MAAELMKGLYPSQSSVGERFRGDDVIQQSQERFLPQYAYQTNGTGRSDHVGIKQHEIVEHERGVRPFTGQMWPPRGLSFDAAQSAEDVRTRRDMMRGRQTAQGWKLKRDFAIRYENAVQFYGKDSDLAKYYERILDNWHSKDSKLPRTRKIPQLRAQLAK